MKYFIIGRIANGSGYYAMSETLKRARWRMNDFAKCKDVIEIRIEDMHGKVIERINK